MKYYLLILVFLISCNSGTNIYEIPTSTFSYKLFPLDNNKTTSSYYFGYTDIAINKNDEILVLDSRNNILKKYSNTGEILNTFGKTGQDKQSLLSPSEIKLDNNGNIYVLDWGNKRMLILNSHLEYLASFSIEKFNYYEPPTFTILSNGNIIIYFPKINNAPIHLLNKNGNIIDRFGKIEAFENPPFEGPSEVATWVMNKASIISKGDKIYVFYLARPLIRIYSKDGYLIKEVLIHGSEIKKLKQDDKERKEKYSAINENKLAYKWTGFHTDVLKTDKGNFLMFLPTKLGAIYLLNDDGKIIRKFKSKEAIQNLLATQKYAILNDSLIIGLATEYNNLYKINLETVNERSK